MVIEVDILCMAIEALSERELLILRARGPEEENGVPVQLVTLGLDGKTRKVMPDIFFASCMAVSRDKRHVYVPLEEGEGWVIRKITL